MRMRLKTVSNRSSRTSFHSSATARNVEVEVIDYDQVKKIKEDRFGKQLEDFKRIFEEPLTEAYNTVNLIKSSYSNRQARYIMRDVRKKRKEKKTTEKMKKVKFLTSQEKNIEKAMHSYLKRDLDAAKAGHFFLGRTKKERKDREKFVRSLMTNEKFRELPNNNMDLLDIHHTTQPVHTLETNTADRWESETSFDVNDLASIVAKEVEARGFKMTTNWSDKWHAERDRKFANPLTNTVAKIATNFTGYLPGDRVLNRPALLKPTRERKKHKNRFKRMTKVCTKYPIGFESSHYPLDSDKYDPYNVRKCTMYCKLHSLCLPKPVRTRLLQMAGHLYDPRKDLLILKYQKKRTFAANKQYVVGILSALLKEAYKADLNFIPSQQDKLLPHQIVEQELERNVIEEEQNRLNSFDSIKDVSHFTVFQVTSLPFMDNEILLKREKVEKYINKLSAE